MKTIPFYLLLLLPCIGIGQVAADGYHRLGLEIGGQQSHVLDQQFSPLIYKADELVARLIYEGKQNRSDWHVSLQVASGGLFPAQYADRFIYNSEEEITADITTDSFLVHGTSRTLQFSLGYAHDVIRHNGFELNLGAGVRNQLMYPETFVNLGILNSASLFVSTRGTWYLNSKNQLRGELSVPVMGFNTRFPYSGTVSLPNQTLLSAFFDGGTRFVSFGQYMQINFGASFRRMLSPALAAGLRYDFMWQQYRHPEILRSYSGSFKVTLDYSF